MSELWEAVQSVLTKYSLVTAFAAVGLVVWVSYTISSRVTKGRMHGSAIAILIGLLLAYIVPYGAMTATFYTGLGCLLGPSVIYLVIRAIVG